MSDAARRAFVHRETMALGRFLDVDGPLVVGWRRSYSCECGFRCTAPGAIYDHAQTCGPRGQLALPVGQP